MLAGEWRLRNIWLHERSPDREQGHAGDPFFSLGSGKQTVSRVRARDSGGRGTMPALRSDVLVRPDRGEAELKERLPAARRNIVILFVLSVIPCVAPLAALFGAIWYRSNRETIRALPALYGGLCKIALGLGAGQTILMVVMLMLFSVFRAS